MSDMEKMKRLLAADSITKKSCDVTNSWVKEGISIYIKNRVIAKQHLNDLNKQKYYGRYSPFPFKSAEEVCILLLSTEHELQ